VSTICASWFRPPSDGAACAVEKGLIKKATQNALTIKEAAVNEASTNEASIDEASINEVTRARNFCMSFSTRGSSEVCLSVTLAERAADQRAVAEASTVAREASRGG
jgi:hypothetical protein